VTAERADGGKLRCNCATWDDAVVILPGEALTLVNIDRQARTLRAKASGRVVKAPPAAPREDDFEGEAPRQGSRHTPIAEGPSRQGGGTTDLGEAPPDEGVWNDLLKGVAGASTTPESPLQAARTPLERCYGINGASAT
jgi:hypothetical protein